MYDIQTEAALRRAAEQMPRPQRIFRAETYEQTHTPIYRRPSRRLAVLCCILGLCLFGGIGVYAYGPEIFAGNYGAWVSYYPDTNPKAAQRILKRYDFTVPETLAGLPYAGMTGMSAARHDTNEPEARLNPRYVWYSLEYEQPQAPDADFDPKALRIDLSLGGTDNDYWSYAFGFDPATLTHLPPESNAQITRTDLGTLEYNGRTVWMYRSDFIDDSVGQDFLSATWLSADGSICFSLTVSPASADLEAIVQEAIDQNP